MANEAALDAAIAFVATTEWEARRTTADGRLRDGALDRPWSAPRIVQRPAPAVVSAVGIWMVWVTMVVLACELLPADIGASGVFVAMTWLALAVLVAGAATAYLRRVSVSSVREGLLIGLVWAASFILLDLVHYYLMHPALLDGYVSRTVPPYVVVPALTAVLLGGLRGRPAGPPRGGTDASARGTLDRPGSVMGEAR